MRGGVGETSALDRHPHRHVAVELRQPVVQRHEPAAAGPGQTGEVGVGHLAVPDDALQRDLPEAQGVRPELVTVGGLQDLQRLAGVAERATSTRGVRPSASACFGT